ncbi:MAG TPA: hypothetical protein VF486_16140 [Actinomycetes bacterium]
MADRPEPTAPVLMDLFVDLASGFTCWIPRWPVEASAREERVVAARRPDGRRLPGRLGAWLGGLRRPPCGAA